jgi:hypothetical protein
MKADQQGARIVWKVEPLLVNYANAVVDEENGCTSRGMIASIETAISAEA